LNFWSDLSFKIYISYQKRKEKAYITDGSSKANFKDVPSTYSKWHYNQNHTELKEEAHYTIKNPEKHVQHFKHPNS
jgi:hypothetical protein